MISTEPASVPRNIHHHHHHHHHLNVISLIGCSQLIHYIAQVGCKVLWSAGLFVRLTAMRRYVLPVLWMTSRFHIMQRIGQNKKDTYVSSSSPGGGTGGEVCRIRIFFKMKVHVLRPSAYAFATSTQRQRQLLNQTVSTQIKMSERRFFREVRDTWATLSADIVDNDGSHDMMVRDVCGRF